MNYKIEETEKPIQLCPDSFCPMKRINLDVKIQFEAQHDGHGWTQEEADAHERDLLDEIKEDLNQRVEKFVKKIKPYNCHVFEKSVEPPK